MAMTTPPPSRLGSSPYKPSFSHFGEKFGYPSFRESRGKDKVPAHRGYRKRARLVRSVPKQFVW